MEEYTIVTQGSATYLEGTLGADELLDEVDRGMLVSNQISGMLPLSIQWINADCRLLYNITGLTPLVQAARILEHETRLGNFFMALCRAEKECDEYLLDPHKIDLTPEHVYLDAAGRAYVMYVPVQKAPDKYAPTELASYVLRMVGRQMPQDSRVIGILSRQLLYGGNFSFADLEKQLDDTPVQVETPKPSYSEPKPRAEDPIISPPPRPEPVYKPEPVHTPAPAPAPAAAQQPVHDNPFEQKGNPIAESQPEKPEKKDEKAEKEKKKKKSGGLFGGLFGGNKDKKKHTEEEQENPFQQQAPAPEQPAYRPAPAAPANVPPQQPVQQAGGHTVVLVTNNGGAARTTIMGAGSSGGAGELYLVQKATNQYIHITHTNFHIGRAEDVVDYTVHTQNCYLGNDHAYILLENGCYYIVDNNTQNHTYLNEQRLEPSKPTQFHAGDTIRMADIVFSVVAGS